MQKVISYLAIVVILSIITGIVAYQRMDKNKYMATVFLGRMDTNLMEWFKKLTQICALPFVKEEYSREIKILISKYDSIGKRQITKKVNIVNRMRVLATEIFADYCKEHDELKTLLRELDDIFSDFYDIYIGYNKNANKFNYAMDGKVSGMIGKLFRLEKLTVMEELYILIR